MLTYAGARPATATHFKPDEQRMVEQLPFGFSGASCETAAHLPAGALASLDWGQDAGLDSPFSGHFTSFADPDHWTVPSTTIWPTMGRSGRALDDVALHREAVGDRGADLLRHFNNAPGIE